MTTDFRALCAELVETWDADGMQPRQYRGRALAAALRALADQVTPSDAVEPRNYLPMAMECQRIRAEILAIATELEGQ